MPPRGDLARSLRAPLFAGVAVAALFFGGLALWSATAPLASAALAPGVVSPDGSRRTVQHLEGGIVREILVQDGSRVAAGQVLLVLDDSAARSNRGLLLSQMRAHQIAAARLTAERDGRDSVDLPLALAAAQEQPEVAALIAAQLDLFARRSTHIGQRKALLQQKIAQLDEEIAGLRQQIVSQNRQLVLIAEEAQAVAQLLDKGLERRPRLLALQRTQSEIEGGRAGNTAAIARAQQAIGEARVQIAALEAQRQEEIGAQLAEVTAQVEQAAERLRHAEEVLQRVAITAPVDGTVVQLRARTVGGVIAAGQPILDVVPRDEDLLIDAKVAVTDIDVVHAGLPAQIVLSAFKQRNLPRIEGRVRVVSADRLVEGQNAQPYFLARVEVDRTKLRQIAPDIELTPGMPAEVMIIAGHRTALQYLTGPFLESLRRSFRES